MLVASDFDGTLAPIVAEPERAAPLPAALMALSTLAARPDFRVAIVSGRALADLRGRCPVPNCWYVGGHGNETHSPDGGDDLTPAPMEGHAAIRERLQELAAELRRRLPDWPGTQLEVKPYSLAVHFRQAPQWAPAIRDAFSALAAQAPFRVLLGRQVVELMPQNALTKGHAVLRLSHRLACDLVFYFGDDATDEDVFRLPHEHIIGVKVAHDESPGELTAADFRLSSPAAVAAALVQIATERPAASPRPDKKSEKKKKLHVSAVQP